ncbi:MAG: RdgB/HAM1 family non-canonical purine NTP pyrophosphatase [Defluviitaleaceae bacterium]|nr:RdgB/HAM1 family non-canonical purine NTP pyrophosphatase [Defluviitaleaceae bacterium]
MIFATKNEGKLAEIKKIIDCVSMTEYGIDVDIEEDGETYLDNAFKKAETIALISGKPCLADDSGVEIAHLNGLPGKDAAIYLMSNGRYKERNLEILKMLENSADRSARYVCYIVYATPEGEKFYTTATIEGEIAKEARGKNGFAYDEIFIPCDFPSRTMAELSIEEKNKISHRAKALNEMKALLNLNNTRYMLS